MAATVEQMRELADRLLALERDNAQMVEELRRVRQEGPHQQIVEAFREALEETRGRRSGGNLIDTKGLNKPSVFSDDESSFITWSRKLENFVANVYREARELLAIAAEQVESVTYQVLQGDDLQNPRIGQEMLEEIDDQLYVVLSSLTDGEAFNITVSAGSGNGFEAWRRLNRRFDPITAGRSRSILRSIMDPGRAKLQDLQAAIERLEELMRRYESRRDTAGQRRTLAEDIKMAALEAMLPDELERHVQMNKNRITSYALMREEVTTYAESRAGVTTKAAAKPPSKPVATDPNAMDTSALWRDTGKGKKVEWKGKGKGDSKGKGKDGKGKGKESSSKGGRQSGKKGSMNDAYGSAKQMCWNCDKPGHVAKDCWAPPRGQGKAGGKQGGKTSKDSKNSSKGGQGSLDYEPEQERDAGALEMCCLDSRHDECLQLASFEDSEKSRWVRMNFDTGSAKTAFPLEMDGGEAMKTESVLNFRTATGEIINSTEGYSIRGITEHQQLLKFKGVKAPVHKVLLSAGDVTGAGNDAFLMGDFGYIIHGNSPVHAELRAAFREIAARHSYEGIVTMYKERNVYNLYVNVNKDEEGGHDLCPYDEGQPGDEEMQAEDEAVEQEVPKQPHRVKAPTREEVEDHESSGHAVYRTWCRHCVAGKGQQHPRLKQTEESLEVEACFDYGYMGRRAEERAPIICARETGQGSYAATTVPTKGAAPYAIAYMVGWLKGLGYKKIIFRSDNEHALLKLLDKVSENLMGVECVPRTSPEGDSQANGRAEAAVREIKNQCRVLRSELREKYGKPIPEKCSLFTWLPRFAANCVNRYRLGKDGRSAEHRRSGRRWKRPAVNFGEKVMYRPAGAVKSQASLEDRMKMGIYVGHHERSGASMFITEGDRYDMDYLMKCKGCPWAPSERGTADKPMVGAADGPEVIEMPQPAATAAGGAAGEAARASQLGMRKNFYVMRADIEKYGTTASCAACRKMLEGQQPTTGHNKECRDNILKKLKEEGSHEASVRVSAHESKVGRPQGEAVEDLRAKRSRVEQEERPAQEVAGEPPQESRETEASREMRLEVTEDTLTMTWSCRQALSCEKIKMVPAVAKRLKEAMRHHELDASEEEIVSMAICLCSLAAVDVAEIYTPPRFTPSAASYGMRPGFCIDLTTVKANGQHWDLAKEEDQKEFEELQAKEEPKLLIGSPPCTDYCPLLRLSQSKEEVDERRRVGGDMHIRVCAAGYRRQLEANAYFLHEHPKRAASWKLKEMEELAADPRVFKVHGPMCNWNLRAENKHGETGYIRKETTWLTNSVELAKTLRGVCANHRGGPMHRHLHLIGGERVKAAASYTPELVRGVLRAFQRQLAHDNDEYVQHSFDAGPVPDKTLWWDEPESYEEVEKAWDDINQEELDAKEVRKARQEEMQWVKDMKVFKTVPEAECYEKQGKPLTMRWIDTRKVTGKYRSRLVCREIKRAKKVEDRLDPAEVFSAMPPIESLKMLISEWMTLNDGHDIKDFVMATFDISRAHFSAEQNNREVYATLPEGFEKEGHVAKMLKAMYGTEDAAHLWGETWAGQLEKHKVRVGTASRALFANEKYKGLCHGDDFVVLCKRNNVEEFKGILSEKFDVKCGAIIGFAEKDDKIMAILNREVRINDVEQCVELEADKRHVEKLLKELGLEKCSIVTTPRVKLALEEVQAHETSPLLSPAEATKYRSATMRLKYVDQDRIDITESVKCLAQHMAAPREGHLTELKRLVRYLRGAPYEKLIYKAQEHGDIECYVDSDWAGSLKDRRSTSGMLLFRGSHLLRSSSTLQSITALSSAEAEYYAATKGAAYALGTRSYFRDLGRELGVTVHTDSSSGRSFASRRGLGKMRHICTRYLWLQEQISGKTLKLLKIAGTANPADIMTKQLPVKDMHRYMYEAG
ncbi:unnamed protein product, partial [Prorocentrum cordatum]